MLLEGSPINIIGKNTVMKAVKGIKTMKSSFSTTHNLATLIDHKRQISHKKFQRQCQLRLMKNQDPQAQEMSGQEAAAQEAMKEQWGTLERNEV